VKVLKFFIKFVCIFILVFVIYTFIYHYQVGSSTKVQVKNTFVPSENYISQVASKDGSSQTQVVVNPTEATIPKDGFYIEIKKIGLFKPVVKNVDPRYRDVYVESWKTGVSHGKFTALPDQIGNVYLFAHAVSDEKQMDAQHAWFTLIDQLVENDEIILYYNGKKYTYQVSSIYFVSPTATGVYTGTSPVPKLTLQTCGPPRGSIDNRYMVEALQVRVEEY
jgi:LPXTG-site transpeptidase (sortase) family protein